MKQELICEKLTNKNGIEVLLLNLGAALIGVSASGAAGGRTELTLGYEKPEDYIQDSLYFGSTPGRYANRIGGARFSLNGQDYALAPNEGRNQLHGGPAGFAKQYWQTERDGDTVTFTYVSHDGENGYPGTLTAKTAYSLTDNNEIIIKYTADADADTVVNLTNHAFFNLGGGSETILNHELRLYSDSFIVTDKENIPTGEVRKTAGTPLDFSSPKTLGEVVRSDYEAVRNVNGIDSCFVLEGGEMRLAAVLSDPVSGRALEVETDLPGIQIYTGQGLPEGTAGRGGMVYGSCSGVCIEAQRWPDAPNRPEFPSAMLRKGETFAATTIYRFKV